MMGAVQGLPFVSLDDVDVEGGREAKSIMRHNQAQFTCFPSTTIKGFTAPIS